MLSVLLRSEERETLSVLGTTDRKKSRNNKFQLHGIAAIAPSIQKNVRNPTTTTSQKSVAIHTSNLYCNTPPICIAVLLVPLCFEEKEILSVLPFVSQYASHLYCSTPPICIAVLLGKLWWLWSPGCSPAHLCGRLIFIHHQCWEVLSFLTIQRQRCIKILCPKDPEFYSPLALNCQKGQHLPAPGGVQKSVSHFLTHLAALGPQKTQFFPTH